MQRSHPEIAGSSPEIAEKRIPGRSLGSSIRGYGLGSLCAIAIASLGGCFVPEQGAYDQVIEFWEAQNYFQAYQELERVRAEDPEDPEGERIHEFVRRDYLLWKARNAIFANEEVEALGLLEEVLTRDTDDAEALGLRSKCRQKLAVMNVQRAQTLQISELDKDLREAFRLYSEALEFDPGNVEAEEGLAEVDGFWAKRRANAEERRIGGIRALANGFPDRAAHDFQVALDEDPRMESIDNAYAQARREIAEQNFALGQRAEENAHWDSARAIYESLADSGFELSGLEERLEFVTKESEARKLFQQAEVAIFQANFADARELLEEAAGLSEIQRADIAIAQILVTEREAEIRAAQAGDQDLQGELRRALEIYLEIQADAPVELDVDAKIKDLQIRIEEATKAYDAGRKAEDVGDDEEAISQYGLVELFWPGHEDAAERKAALEAKAAGMNGESTSEGEPSDASPAEEVVTEQPAQDGPQQDEPQPAVPQQDGSQQELPAVELPAEEPVNEQPVQEPSRIVPIPLVEPEEVPPAESPTVENPTVESPASGDQPPSGGV
ncbi:MAG: hypothetical protein AAF196_00220 [Planctomycetota bacterium]